MGDERFFLANDDAGMDEPALFDPAHSLGRVHFMTVSEWVDAADPAAAQR